MNPVAARAMNIDNIETTANLMPRPQTVVTRLVEVDGVPLAHSTLAARGLLVEHVRPVTVDDMRLVEVTVWGRSRMITLQIDPDARVTYQVPLPNDREAEAAADRI